MKALLTNFKTGQMTVTDVPPPAVRAGGMLVRNAASLVSAGTEKAVVELARMSSLRKARARPDLVRRVLDKVAKDGIIDAARAVWSRLDTPIPLGYSCAGTVQAVGAGVTDIQPGTRVACAGAGHANHAEAVFVPRNLVVPIPDSVSFQDAAFVTVGAIALNGVRQADAHLGETVAIIGLGLVGQITAQICTAAGYRVFGIDLDAAKVALARNLGADDGAAITNGDVPAAVLAFTRGRGADAVLITAGTKSNDPIELAADIAGDRATVVAVGDVGLGVPRQAFYHKELELRLSRSYGPGRYDAAYEERGQDYPIGYVRWTENRNMEAFLDMVAAGTVRLDPLITHRYPIDDAPDAYDLLTGETQELAIGILLNYDQAREHAATVSLGPPNASAPAAPPRAKPEGTLGIGVIGAGSFAKGVLLPKLKAQRGVDIRIVASEGGLSAHAVAEKYGAPRCTSDYAAVLAEADVDAVLVATRHDSHAEIAAAALEAGKHVFMEKPMAINETQLMELARAYGKVAASPGGAPQFLVGFNRRFSPLARMLKDSLGEAPLMMVYRINAGTVAADNWQQDPAQGGGRIVGEVCHFIDTMQFLADASPVEVFATAGENARLPTDPDNLSIQLRFADGSVGSILYVSNGDSAFPKERLEVFGGGIAAAIDNWRHLTVRGPGVNLDKKTRLESAKGHAEEMAAFIATIRSGIPAIPFEDQKETTLATFAIQRSLRTGTPQAVAFADDDTEL